MKFPAGAWSWPVGGEFWASAARIRARPRSFWRTALRRSLEGRPYRRFKNPRSAVTGPAYCFESLWHYLLGEPLREYVPPWDLLEQYPRVAYEERRRVSGKA
jgi:hypothetical protein